MKRPKSDIPQDATEVVVSDYREDGMHVSFRTAECILKGEVVGRRSYDQDGHLMMETTMKNGKRHGREYVWDENGDLLSVEPYFEGKLHGVSKQYGRNGKVIGTYRCVRGTGYDIWRFEREDGTTGVSEIHILQDNLAHGYEWWLKSDQQHSVWHERHWQHGEVHGIERMWNEQGKLKRGYPKYWVKGQAVNKRLYLKAAEQDKTLPEFLEKENQPRRNFPVEIENILAG